MYIFEMYFFLIFPIKKDLHDVLLSSIYYSNKPYGNVFDQVNLKSI